MKSSGPWVIFTIVFAFLVFSSASSFGQRRTLSQSGNSVLCVRVPYLAATVPPHNLALIFEPLWNGGDWHRKKKTGPVAVPEGGSPLTYMVLASFVCLTAVILGERQRSARRSGR